MTPKKKFRQFWEEFCHNSSMHGLKYIVSHEATPTERILWIFFFILGLCSSLYFCWSVWKKWDESPLLMSLDTNHHSVNSVPFPAVTICNVNKVSKAKLKDVLEANPGVSYEAMVPVLRFLTKLDRAINQLDKLQESDQYLKSHNWTMAQLIHVLQMSAPSCADLVADCTFQGVPSACDPLFTSRPTDDGYCCTFNGGQYSDVQLGINYSSYSNGTLRVSGNGYRMGLSMILNARTDDYSVTNGKFDGFKILIHSPDQFPDVSERGFVIGPGFETYSSLKVISTFATPDVGSRVSLRKRRCLVDDERQLEFFPKYSQSGCEVECATRLMLERCHCRPYFFRAAPGTPLCEFEAFVCVSDVYEEVQQRSADICDCPPTCSDISYEPEISYASFPGRGFNLSRTYARLISQTNLAAYGGDGHAYMKSNFAVLHVYYKDRTGPLYKIDIRYSFEDFIAAMGGLLGLGLGFSLISAIELLYFVCLRCCKRRTDDLDIEMAPSSPKVTTESW